MIGSKQFTIGPEDIVRGVASSDYVSDGGLSNLSTFGMNLTVKPGVLFGAATTVNAGGTFTGLPIASCGDSINGFLRVVLTDNGKVFTWDGSSFTERVDSSSTYQQGISDIIQYKGYTYISSLVDVAQITGATFGTINEDWWSADVTTGTALTTGVPHPMVIFEDNLWIGNGNKLHKFDGTTIDTVGSEGFLTLPTGQTIVTLAVDPNSGKMLISVTEGTANIGGTLSMVPKVHLYDGFSLKVIRAVIVDDIVTAMYPVGGVVYMAYGKNLGYWNGSGINWMRKFKNVTLTQNSLVYKHKITNIDKTLYIIDGAEVLAYGEVLPGKPKVFYPAAQNASGTVQSFICNLGSGKLGFGSGNTASPFFWTFDTTSSATTDSINFYSRKYRFKKKVILREITFQYLNTVAAGANAATVVAINQTGTTNMSALTNGESAAVYELSCLPAEEIPASKYIQFQYQGTAVNYGIEQITVSYDEVE